MSISWKRACELKELAVADDVAGLRAMIDAGLDDGSDDGDDTLSVLGVVGTALYAAAERGHCEALDVLLACVPPSERDTMQYTMELISAYNAALRNAQPAAAARLLPIAFDKCEMIDRCIFADLAYTLQSVYGTAHIIDRVEPASQSVPKAVRLRELFRVVHEYVHANLDRLDFTYIDMYCQQMRNHAAYVKQAWAYDEGDVPRGELAAELLAYARSVA